jgi:pyridoxamine 5'-phosphate oxidase
VTERATARPASVPARTPLDALVERVWQELTRAPHDRHHDWRTPVLATQGCDGTPQARTVVLRRADSARWTLAAYTDARSAKCAELRAQPAAQMVFWSARLGWQLRVAVSATVVTEGEAVRSAWAGVSTSRAAGDYLGACPPGSPWPADGSAAAPPTHPPDGHHLAVLEFEIRAIDWLELHRDGHRRALVSRDGSVRRQVP